VRQPAP